MASRKALTRTTSLKFQEVTQQRAAGDGVPYVLRKGQEEVMAMFTKITKVVAALALLLGLFSHSAADYRKLIFTVVWLAALVVLAQAFHRSSYFWAATFLAMACLFNPIRPVAFPASMGLLLEMAAAILFMIALAVLRSKPRLSIASITAPGAGSESL